MAYPTITIDSVLGVADASGAGPSEPLSGSEAFSDVSSATIGLWDSPDISEVEVDGSHALWVETASGRRWSRILGKKTASITTTGDISASSTDVTDIPDTTDMAANDLVRIAGAGPGGVPLVSHITSVLSSTSVRLYHTASTTVNDVTLEDPPYVTVENLYTGITTAFSWAIGGRLPNAIGSSQLWLDVLPGWEVRFVCDPGDTLDEGYEISSTVPLTASGTSSGKIKITGSGSPCLRSDPGTIPYFTLSGDNYEFDGFVFANLTEGILISSSTVKNCVVKNCWGHYDRGTTSYNVDYLVRVTSAVTSGCLSLYGCAADDGCELVKVSGILNRLRVEGCYHDHFSVGTAKAVRVETATPVTVRKCVFDTSYDAVDLGSASTTSYAASEIEDNTFWNIVHDCIYAGHANRCIGLTVRGNLLYSQLYHVDLPSGGKYLAHEIDYNSHYGSARLNNTDLGPHSEVLPTDYLPLLWRDNGDYRLARTYKAHGWPRALLGAASPTPMGNDVGAAQIVDPVGGTMIARVTGAADNDTYVTVSYEILDPETMMPMHYGASLVMKSTFAVAGTMRTEVIDEAIRAHMRDGDLSDLVGKEFAG